MDQRCHEAVARNAWEVYKKAQSIQDKLLEAFLDDFRKFAQQDCLKSLKEEELSF